MQIKLYTVTHYHILWAWEIHIIVISYAKSIHTHFTIKISTKATNIRGWAISISEGKRRQIVSRNVTVWHVGWFIMYRVRWYTTRDGVVVKHCHRVASSWRDISWTHKNCNTFKNTTKNCTLSTVKPIDLDRNKRFVLGLKYDIWCVIWISHTGRLRKYAF